MEDIQHLIQGLPAWAQALIIGAVLVVGAVFGKKRITQTRRSTLKGRSGAPDTPGQYGAGATGDLTPEELRGLKLSYSPAVDGTPDPGEVVWTWVPYAENDGRGKDRPVLIVARLDAHTVAGCYLSTKAHRNFIHVGAGPWDSQGRPSYLNPERVLRISDSGMRREGAIVERAQYERVAKDLRAFYRV